MNNNLVLDREVEELSKQQAFLSHLKRLAEVPSLIDSLPFSDGAICTVLDFARPMLEVVLFHDNPDDFVEGFITATGMGNARDAIRQSFLDGKSAMGVHIFGELQEHLEKNPDLRARVRSHVGDNFPLLNLS